MNPITIPTTLVEQDQILSIITFEQAMAQLDILVKRLDEGKIPLDEAIQTFEWGTKLRQFCQASLENAVLRVETVQNHSVTPISEKSEVP